RSWKASLIPAAQRSLRSKLLSAKFRPEASAIPTEWQGRRTQIANSPLHPSGHSTCRAGQETGTAQADRTASREPLRAQVSATAWRGTAAAIARRRATSAPADSAMQQSRKPQKKNRYRSPIQLQS